MFSSPPSMDLIRSGRYIDRPINSPSQGFPPPFSLRSVFIIRVAKSLAMYIHSRVSRLDILRPLAIIDFPAFRLPPFPPPSVPSRQGDNTAKIISVTRHATCRCNFATISNFLGSLAFSPSLLPRRFPFAEGKGGGDGNRDRITGSEARRKEKGELLEERGQERGRACTPRTNFRGPFSLCSPVVCCFVYC